MQQFTQTQNIKNTNSEPNLQHLNNTLNTTTYNSEDFFKNNNQNQSTELYLNAQNNAGLILNQENLFFNGNKKILK